MRKLFVLALVFLSVGLYAQNVRFDAQVPSISSGSPPYLVANVPPNSPMLSVCHSPANQVPCTNYATTYTSVGVACPNGAQDTPQPATTSNCQSTGDAQGNIGFWAPAGTYDYTVCIQTSCNLYTATLGGSGGSGGLPNGAVSFTNALSVTLPTSYNSQNLLWDCWDNSVPTANAIWPANTTLNLATFVETYTFLTAQSGFCVTNGSGGGGGSSTPTPYADVYGAIGGSDVCSAIATEKALHLSDGINLDASRYSILGSTIQCGSSMYVAGYYGNVILPAGTINVQAPNEFFLQTHSDVYGKGEDATIVKACTGQSYCAGKTFPSNSILGCWTDDGTDCNFNGPTFDTRLYNVGFDGSNISGIILLANYVAQENRSGPHNVSGHGWCNGGIGYNWGGYNFNTSNGPGSQNHDANGLDFYCATGETSTASAIGILGNTGVIGEAGPKHLSNVTVTCNAGVSGFCPKVLIDIKDGTGTIVDSAHVESCTGSGSAGLLLGDGAGVKNIQVNTLTSGQMASCTSLVQLSNNANSNDITLINLDPVGPNFPTNVLVDQITGCTDPTSSETGLAFYAIGGPDSVVNGFARLSSSRTTGCLNQFGNLIYDVDDGPLCHVYSTSGTENCTNNSLTNPTAGFPEMITAFPPGTTSITVINNAIGANTVPIIQQVSGTTANTLTGTTCTAPTTFAAAGLGWTGSTPYVPGTQLGEATFAMNSSYVSGPVCVVIRFSGFDQ